LSNHFVKLGQCNKVHGIKGELNLFLYNSSDSTLKNGQEIFLLSENKNPQNQFVLNDATKFDVHEIERIRFGNKVILKLKNIDNRNQAEEIIPFEIFTSEQSLPALKDDEFYYYQLINSKVYLHKDFEPVELERLESGAQETPNKPIWGHISSLYFNNSNVILVLTSIEGKKLELPYNKNFMPYLSVKKRLVCIVIPEFI
jgi:16S rRNA processing protein RimM